MEKIYSIYRITNTVNDLEYYGRTKLNPDVRWSQHRNMSHYPNNIGHKAMHRAMREEGVHKFTFEVIYQTKCPIDCRDMEKYFINENQSFGKGYNLNDGSGGYRWTYESKLRCASTNFYKSKFGQTQSPDRLEKVIIFFNTINDLNLQYGFSWYQFIRDIYKSTCKWIVVHPDGKIYVVKRLNKFCIDFELSYSSMGRVGNGEHPHHRGFRCTKLSPMMVNVV